MGGVLEMLPRASPVERRSCTRCSGEVMASSFWTNAMVGRGRCRRVESLCMHAWGRARVSGRPPVNTPVVVAYLSDSAMEEMGPLVMENAQPAWECTEDPFAMTWHPAAPRRPRQARGGRGLHTTAMDEADKMMAGTTAPERPLELVCPVFFGDSISSLAQVPPAGRSLLRRTLTHPYRLAVENRPPGGTAQKGGRIRLYGGGQPDPGSC